MNWIRILIIFFLFHSCQFSFGQSEIIQAKIDQWVKQDDFENASIGICISDPKSGRIIASHDPHRSLIPASTVKILSTYAALSTAGKNFQFRTEFLLKIHQQQDSICYGDLWVKGYGDPSFGSYLLPGNKPLSEISDTIVALLKSRGINKLIGKIIVQSMEINDTPENPEWLWYDLGNYYGAGYFGFNVLENSASINLNIPEEINQICEITKVVPSCLSENYCSEAVVVDSEPFETVYVLGSSLHRIYTVKGRIKKTKEKSISFSAAIPNPAEAYQCMLSDALFNRGIVYQDSLIISDLQSSDFLYIHFSQNLQKLASRALQKSVNLYAEAFLQLAGRYWVKNSDRATALKSLHLFYDKKISHMKGIKILDGSGLSPKNRMTAIGMTEILNLMANSKEKNTLLSCLPDAAQTGNLSSRLSRKSHISGKFRLKSGSMEGVRAYAGYWMDSGAPKYSFCLMINNYQCSPEQIKKHIADFLIHLSQN